MKRSTGDYVPIKPLANAYVSVIYTLRLELARSDHSRATTGQVNCLRPHLRVVLLVLVVTTIYTNKKLK